MALVPHLPDGASAPLWSPRAKASTVVNISIVVVVVVFTALAPL